MSHDPQPPSPSRASRFRVGDIFRVDGAAVQPSTLPLDGKASLAELHDLQELNANLVGRATANSRRGRIGGLKKLGKLKPARTRTGERISNVEVAQKVEKKIADGKSLTNARRLTAPEVGLSLSSVARRHREWLTRSQVK